MNGGERKNGGNRVKNGEKDRKMRKSSNGREDIEKIKRMDETQKEEDGGNARDMVKSGKGNPRERKSTNTDKTPCCVCRV